MEKVKNVHLVSEAFVEEGNGRYGLLTPTMKMKRNVARDFFKQEIADMYKNIPKSTTQAKP